jgi:carbonic anhydrase
MTIPNACACCGDPLRRLDRRGFMTLAGAVGLTTAFPPVSFGATGQYEAMLLTCIDPRFPEHSLRYMRSRGLVGEYSQFAIAGAAIGVVAPAFKDWHKTFWDNLAASIELHNIPKIIAVNHRDCGAARIAYGEAAVANPKAESETHRAALAEFRVQVKRNQPKLVVETGLMTIDGTVEMFA